MFSFLFAFSAGLLRGKKGISVKVTVTACGSATFCRVECKQNLFRMDIAIVQISNIVQNAQPILLMALIESKEKGIFNKRCCRVLFVIGLIDFNKSRRSSVERIHFREKRPNIFDVLHLLPFITRKYAFICVKRRPTARRYIN